MPLLKEEYRKEEKINGVIGVVLMLLCMLSVGISNRVFKTDETV